MSKAPAVGIAVVTRARKYSPNNIYSDAQIITRAAGILASEYQYDFSVYSEDTVDLMSLSQPVIMNMCREEASIEALKELERQGRLVINSGYGIENCARDRMTELMIKESIPAPESYIVSTDDPDALQRLDLQALGNCWIKRGKGYSMHKEDVTYVRHAEEAREILLEYRMRGIPSAVICRHIEGDLVKFYGIRRRPFFYCFYPLEKGHSKFGQEQINGRAHHYDFDREALYDICQRTAEATGVDIFGGDCIVTPDGGILIIDFNDWPSFSPCRDQGARAIAEYVNSRIMEMPKPEN